MKESRTENLTLQAELLILAREGDKMITEIKRRFRAFRNNYLNHEQGYGRSKEYVQMCVFQHPDDPTTEIKYPNSKYQVTKDSFWGKGTGQYRGADLLIKELDKMAAYIVEWLLPKTPD